MQVLVLGAGVVGVSSAWFLREAGHTVTVVDRQSGPALETSFANGGQISASHAEPWANPAAPGKVLRWLGQADAPLLFHPRADPAQWRWSAAFLRECLPGRSTANIRTILTLALHSRAVLKELRLALALEYDCATRGILHFYTDAGEFRSSMAPAALMRALGCERRSVSAAEAVALEPALAPIRDRIVGADFCAEDESGDAHRYTVELAERCAARGVEFRYSTAVRSIRIERGHARGAWVTAGGRPAQEIAADAVLVCLATGTVSLLAPLGLRPRIVAGKGYSATFALRDAARAPQVSLTDDEYKIVFSRLGSRLRVAGTAEIGADDLALDARRCAALVRRTRELFAGACDYDAPQFWAGFRPVTPSNVPYLGPTRIPGLYLNTGHGTLGWTLAPGNGLLAAQVVSGATPALPLPTLPL